MRHMSDAPKEWGWTPKDEAELARLYRVGTDLQELIKLHPELNTGLITKEYNDVVASATKLQIKKVKMRG